MLHCHRVRLSNGDVVSQDGRMSERKALIEQNLLKGLGKAGGEHKRQIGLPSMVSD